MYPNDQRTVVDALRRLAAPDHGGADAGVGEKLQVSKCDDGTWMVHTEGDIIAYAGQGDEENKMRRIAAALSKPAPVDANASAEARLREDARRYRRLQVLGCAPYGSRHMFVGDVMRFTNLDEYVDADIKLHPSRGEALTNQPAPMDANASAEARSREALETAAGRFNLMGGVGLVNGVDPKVGYREAMEALSAHPHASDCDKQGER